MRYLLVNQGVVYKSFPTWEQCVTEALEVGWIISWGTDFPGDRPGIALKEGIQIIKDATE